MARRPVRRKGRAAVCARPSSACTERATYGSVYNLVYSSRCKSAPWQSIVASTLHSRLSLMERVRCVRYLLLMGATQRMGGTMDGATFARLNRALNAGNALLLRKLCRLQRAAVAFVWRPGGALAARDRCCAMKYLVDRGVGSETPV